MRRRLAALIAALAGAALVASGCTPMVPTDGPVGTSELDVGGDPAYSIQAASPVEGMDPEEIVLGFINAGVEPTNQYEVAREYMTDEAGARWSSGARTLVYSGDPNVLSMGDDSYSVQMEVESAVDETGILTQFPEGQTQTEEFELEQVDGEWRIADAPEGTMVTSGSFPTVYESHTLYFYDPQQRYAVPDIRWFRSSRTGVPTEIVSALLDGPATYLEPAVTSAFSDGTELQRPTVPVEDGTAVVDLDAEHLRGATAQERLLMKHQLEMVLLDLPTVREVEIISGQTEYEMPEQPTDTLDIERDPSVSNTQVGVLDDTLVRVQDLQTLSIGSLPDISELEPQKPAVPAQAEEIFAFLDGEGERLYHLRPHRDPDLVLTGENLTRPSMDNFGWTWTTSRDDDGSHVHVAAYDETLSQSTLEVSADWLEALDVEALRVSQDGARAVVVADDGGESGLYLAGVVRDSSGTPRGLGEPIALQTTTPPDDVRWLESDALVAWANSEDSAETAERVNLNGSSQAMGSPLLGLQNISAGEGVRTVFAERVDAPYNSRSGDSWDINEQVEVRDYAFPG
ncbi:MULTISPECIES: LpqB family beta-propeller domain-containing protein [Actinomycetes]|uniref:LpqB family beta-propeller domain-containing protein n=2 Tax=Actinomycetes TaxID=1760 RepID=A0ABP6M5H0_9MICC